MELIIIHKNGWACTNKAEKSHRLSEVSPNVYTRYYTVNADDVFNCVGKVEKGQDAFFIFDDQTGWICDVLMVKEGVIKAQKKSELTKDKVNILINQIKKQ